MGPTNLHVKGLLLMDAPYTHAFIYKFFPLRISTIEKKERRKSDSNFVGIEGFISFNIWLFPPFTSKSPRSCDLIWTTTLLNGLSFRPIIISFDLEFSQHLFLHPFHLCFSSGSCFLAYDSSFLGRSGCWKLKQKGGWIFDFRHGFWVWKRSLCLFD